MQTRALSGQRFLSYEFFKVFLFSEKNEFQDGKVEAILGQNEALDEIDRVSTFDNSAFFGAN